MPDFLPRPENDLAGFAANFATRVHNEPGHFGFSQATVDDLVAKQQAYWLALGESQHAATRGLATVSRKNGAKRALVAILRPMAAQLKASPEWSDGQLAVLGITRPRKAVRRVRVPGRAPTVSLSATGNCSFRVRLTDPDTYSRGKPNRVAGASVYIAIGEHGTSQALKWKHHSNQTRSSFEITLKGEIPYGSLVSIRAAWINPRLETGPYSAEKSIRLAGGNASMERGLQLAA